MALARKLVPKVDELLARTPPAFGQAQEVAATILDLRAAAGLKAPHADLGAAYLLLARVHERRAAGRPRIDHLDPTLEVLNRAVAALDAAQSEHLPLLAKAHQSRGRVLRSAFRSAEAWQAYVEAVTLLARAPDVDADRLSAGIGMALEAIERAPGTQASREARRGLAVHASRVLAAAPDDPASLARAHEQLGVCLAGSRADDDRAKQALRAAAAHYADLGDGLRRGWAELRLAWHHWHVGDLAVCKATYEQGRARVDAAGHALDPYAGLTPFQGWVHGAPVRFREIAQGKRPTWLLRDDLPTLLVKEDRVAEAWWAYRAEFFLDLAEQRTAAARAQGGRSLAEALRFQAAVRGGHADAEGAVRSLREALDVLPEGKQTALLRSRIQLDLGIAEHLRWRAKAATTALAAAARGFQEQHGIAHAETLNALALLAAATARSGDVRAGGKLADRLLTSLRTNEALRAFLDARENQVVRGDFVRGVYLLCDALGRITDCAFVVRTLDPELNGALSQGTVSATQALRDQGRSRDLVEQLRRPTYVLLESDAPGGERQILERAPRFLGVLSSIRLSEALLDVGFHDEAYAAGLDASDGLSAMLPDELFLPHFLYSDLRASTLLARVLLERGLAPESLAVARRAHRLQTLIPDWLQLGANEIESVWAGPQLRYVPVWRWTEMRRWAVLSEAQASEVLAHALEATGAGEEALAALSEALDHVRHHLGSGHRRVGELLHARGGAAFRLGHLEAAREDEEAALTVVRPIYGDDHPVTADVMLSLADLDLADGRLAEAMQAYEAVRRVADAKLEPWHLHHVRARSGLGIALARSGKAAEGLEHVREALRRVVRRIRETAVGATEPERLALLAARQWVLANWLEVSRAAGEHGYDEVLSLRALVGRLRAADERAWRRDAKSRADHDELRSLQRQLARLARVRGGSKWHRFAWRREVATLQAAIAKLTRQLAKGPSAYRKEQRAPEATSARLAKRGLRKSEALVDVLDAGGRYTAWVLVKGADEPARIELGEDGPIEHAIGEFRDAVLDQEYDAAACIAAAKRVHATLWAPIAGALPEGTRTVYVVPGGNLPAIPLAALPGEAEGSVLAEELLLVHLTMPHALLPLPTSKPTGRGFVTVGDVDFDEAERDVRGERVSPRTGRKLTGLRHGLLMKGAKPLASSGPEAAWIEKELRRASRVKGGPTSLRGKQATESRLRKAVSGKAVLHLATHAVVRDGADARIEVPGGERFRLQPGLEIHAHRFDPMLMSGVLLAGVNPRVHEGEDDGMLTALEAAQLDLDAAELVVLSACSSAQGVHQSAEGTLGLVQGFRLAGAQNVVGSLWKVWDDETQAWMRDFYARWTKRSSVTAAEALRQTALAMRRGELGESGRQPRNWAAFVAYGPLR